MEKEFAIARKKLRNMMDDYAAQETRPNLRFFSRSGEPAPEDDGLHADRIPGLRPEPVYLEEN